MPIGPMVIVGSFNEENACHWYDCQPKAPSTMPFLQADQLRFWWTF